MDEELAHFIADELGSDALADIPRDKLDGMSGLDKLARMESYYTGMKWREDGCSFDKVRETLSKLLSILRSVAK